MSPTCLVCRSFLRDDTRGFDSAQQTWQHATRKGNRRQDMLLSVGAELDKRLKAG